MTRRSDTKKPSLAWRCFAISLMLVGALMAMLGFAPESWASDLTNINSATCELLRIASGKVVMGAGGLAVAFTGIMAFFGRIDWGTVLVTATTIGVAGGGIQLAEYFVGAKNDRCIIVGSGTGGGGSGGGGSVGYQPPPVNLNPNNGDCTRESLRLELVANQGTSAVNLGISWVMHPSAVTAHYVVKSNNGCWDLVADVAQESVIADEVVTDVSSVVVPISQDCPLECVDAEVSLELLDEGGSILCLASKKITSNLCPLPCNQALNPLTVTSVISGYELSESVAWAPHVNSTLVMSRLRTKYGCSGGDTRNVVLDGQATSIHNATIDVSVSSTCRRECVTTSVDLTALDHHGREFCKLTQEAPKVCSEVFCDATYLDMQASHTSDIAGRSYRASSSWTKHNLAETTKVNYRYVHETGVVVASGQANAADRYDLPIYIVHDGLGGCFHAEIDVVASDADGAELCRTSAVTEAECYKPICSARYLSFKLVPVVEVEGSRTFWVGATWRNHPDAGPDTRVEFKMSGASSAAFSGTGRPTYKSSDITAPPYAAACYNASGSLSVLDVNGVEICSARADNLFGGEKCFEEVFAGDGEMPGPGQACVEGTGVCATAGGACTVDGTCPDPCAGEGVLAGSTGFGGCCEALVKCPATGRCQVLGGCPLPEDPCASSGLLPDIDGSTGGCCIGLIKCAKSGSNAGKCVVADQCLAGCAPSASRPNDNGYGACCSGTACDQPRSDNYGECVSSPAIECVADCAPSGVRPNDDDYGECCESTPECIEATSPNDGVCVPAIECEKECASNREPDTDGYGDCCDDTPLCGEATSANNGSCVPDSQCAAACAGDGQEPDADGYGECCGGGVDYCPVTGVCSTATCCVGRGGDVIGGVSCCSGLDSCTYPNGVNTTATTCETSRTCDGLNLSTSEDTPIDDGPSCALADQRPEGMELCCPDLFECSSSNRWNGKCMVESAERRSMCECGQLSGQVSC